MFLDSCIFQSYAIEFEGVNNFMCESVINNPIYYKHSSSNVIGEVTHTSDKRLNLYRTILTSLRKGLKMEDFNPEECDIFLNLNDRRHLKQLVSHLTLYKDIETTLRAYCRNYRNSLKDALDCLISIFTSINNPYIRDIISNEEIHREDAAIILDAYYWSSGKNNPKYLTLERQAIIGNRDQILHILQNQCCEIAPTNLELLHISELHN